MLLPNNFTFSQQSLQDFVDCPYRFFLRYIQNMQWPAVESEPALIQEERMEMGQRFHELAHQYFTGIDPELLTSTIDSPQLLNWWKVFQEYHKMESPGRKYPEHLLSLECGGYRLLAKYDLLVAAEDGRYVIFDWKTSHRRTPSNRLQERMQSSVYPFVLAEYLRTYTPVPIDPSLISMQYWFPEYPSDPCDFLYSQSQFNLDGEKIRSLIGLITSLPLDGWSRTTDLRQCLFCRYRSYCDRGIEAGNSQDDDIELIDRDSLNFDAL
jgi:hypothetical protein